MKRKEFLLSSLKKEENVEATIAMIVEKDRKAFKRAKRDVADKIEELEEKIEERLRADTPIDASVVTSMYASLLDARKNLKAFKSFEAEYLTEEN